MAMIPTISPPSASRATIGSLSEMKNFSACFNERRNAGASAPVEPPLWLVLPGAALFGGLAGALFGWAQWLVLRRHAQPAQGWITANAAGWALGLPWSYLAGSLADVSSTPAVAVLYGVLAGALMGLSVALATARALTQLEPLTAHGFTAHGFTAHGFTAHG